MANLCLTPNKTVWLSRWPVQIPIPPEEVCLEDPEVSEVAVEVTEEADTLEEDTPHPLMGLHTRPHAAVEVAMAMAMATKGADTATLPHIPIHLQEEAVIHTTMVTATVESLMATETGGTTVLVTKEIRTETEQTDTWVTVEEEIVISRLGMRTAAETLLVPIRMNRMETTSILVAVTRGQLLLRGKGLAPVLPAAKQKCITMPA